MTDSVNRPSASEDAARLAQQAQMKKTKQSEKATEKGAQSKALQDKGPKSSFDDMLSKLSESGNSISAGQENKFDSKIKESARDQDQSSSEDEDSEDDKKPKEKMDVGKKGKDGVLQAHERVVGKQQSGGQQQDSGKGSGDEKGQSGRGFNQKTTLSEQNFQTDMKKQQQVSPTPLPEMPKIQLNGVQAIEGAEAPRELPKAVFDQVVQAVRIGHDKDLNKEIQIDFNDKVFNGLRLKVTAHGKEVSVEFIVPNRSAREAFVNERENIALALGEKGVDVRSIMVTMR